MQSSRPRPSSSWSRALPIVAFLVTLLPLLVLTAGATAFIYGVRAQVDQVAAGRRPPDGEHYLASDTQANVDHHVHYFGIDAEVLRRMRAARVLFVGNSRLMFALRPAVARPFFEAHALPFYMLAFGFREADAFPLALIRKFDLKPDVVVVNADGFFAGGLSAWAETVMRDTPFAARKWQWESEVGHRVRGWFEFAAPNWLTLFGKPGIPERRGITTYRSREDGTVIVSPWPRSTDGFRAGPVDGPPLARDEVAAARAFKAELDRRGARLILTRVPTPAALGGGAPARFAALLDVPLVVVDPPALTSHDGSHLGQGSAHDWSRAFLDALAPHLDALNREAGEQ